MTHPKLDGRIEKFWARLTGARRHGWHPRPFDARDHVAEVKHMLGAVPTPPQVFSLRAAATLAGNPIDQASEGSCVGNATIDTLTTAYAAKYGVKPVQRSRNFVYYNARRAAGLPVTDDGCDPRQAAAALRTYGAPHESAWPYVESKVNKQPSATAYLQARSTHGCGYSFVGATEPAAIVAALKAAIFSLKTPAPMGIVVGDTFDNAQPGQPVGLYTPGTERGGHYVTIVGWDDTLVPGETTFEVLNSWGSNWCDNGFVLLRQAYVTHPTSGDYLVLSDWSELK